MARTLAKDRYLPSLLDRLTDDDPVNHKILKHQKEIESLEQEISALAAPQRQYSRQQLSRMRAHLRQQLNQERQQYYSLKSSVSSLKDLRACVKRDLDWLLNASQYSPQEELTAYPYIARSVLNYGMPDLTGKTVSGFDLRDMQRLLKQVVIDFEPRIMKKTLIVRVLKDKSMFDHNAVTFEIEGELWAEPQPLHLHLRTEFEFENGEVSVYEYRPD